MDELTGAIRTYLRGQAHHLKPVVQLGKNGLSEEFLASVNEALDAHELIKVKFISFKDERKTLAPEMAIKTRSELVGLIGNIAILYRQHYDKARRKIEIPSDLY
jgi:RNA-binding protein